SNVSRILTQARDRGLVEITIHDPEGPPRRDDALEAALRASFSLREAHVGSAPRTTGMEAVAREGAALLVERAPHVGSIGVSWGQTVQSVVEQLETQNLRPRPRVLPRVGGHSALDQLDAGESVLRVLACRLGARPETLYAPGMLESASAVETLRSESSIGQVLADAARRELARDGMARGGVQSSPPID